MESAVQELSVFSIHTPLLCIQGCPAFSYLSLLGLADGIEDSRLFLVGFMSIQVISL